MEHTADFTKGRILIPLLRFALPVLGALFLQAMYGAVNLLIVGKFATTADVSAVATGSMMMQSITTALTSLAMGITILLGQKLGEGKKEETGAVIGAGIMLFFLIAVIFTIVFVAGVSLVAGILKAPEHAFSETTAYLRICSAGILFIVAFNTLGSIFRGIGDSKIPLLTVAIACVCNIGLDLLFVDVLHWGAAGAALATVLSQAVSVVISLIVISKRKMDVTFSRKDIRFHKEHIKKILTFGIPVSLQDLLVNISFLVIMAIVNSLGLTQSAGVGIAEKVCAFLMLIPIAYMQSLSSFIAQNVGAGKMDRAYRALLYSIATSFVTALFMFYLAFFHGAWLSRLFANDTAVIAMSADYLKAYAIDCLLTVELFCFNGFFSGMGKTNFVMIQGFIGAFLVRIPVSFLMSRLPHVSLFYIGLASPISTFIQISICGSYLLYTIKKGRRTHPCSKICAANTAATLSSTLAHI